MPREREGSGLPPGIGLSDINLVIFSATETTGRPLHEKKAYPSFLANQLDRGMVLQTIPSRYSDSRAGEDIEINISALEAMTKGEQKQRLLDGLVWVHDASFEGDPPDRMTDDDMLDVAIVGESLPSYLMLRARGTVHRMQLPEEVGNIYKAALGIRTLAYTKIHDGLSGEIKGPEEVYTAADSLDLLRDQEEDEYACAAPQDLIIKAADALIFGNGGDAHRSVLSTLISEEEIPSLLGYSELLAQYNETVDQLRGQRQKIPIKQFYTEFARIQFAMNEMLGRDPLSVPPLSPFEIAELQRNGFIKPIGSLLKQALDETETEREAFDEALWVSTETVELPTKDTEITIIDADGYEIEIFSNAQRDREQDDDRER